MHALLEERRHIEFPFEWEETPCLLCASWLALPVVEATDVRCRVVRCRDCGLTYTNPRPSVRSIARFYPANYPPYQHRETREAVKRGLFAAVLPLPREGRLLDFGCGAGEILQEMHRRGWRVTGLDMSPQVVRDIRVRLGLPALLGTLPHADLAPGSFEAITMSQSLEHVHDPLQVLRAARRLLTPGGRLVVGVPNIDGLPFRWFGADWRGLDLPRHLTHFAPSTLRLMLERAGFRVESLEMVRHNSWLRRSADQAFQKPDRHPLWRRLLRYRLAASVAGWYSIVRKRANCIHAIGVVA